MQNAGKLAGNPFAYGLGVTPNGLSSSTASISEPVEGERETLYYATALGTAGSAGFSASRTTTIYTEAPRAADELVARIHGEPERPGGFTTPQHTARIGVPWSCDDGKGGKNAGTCDITGIISARACVNPIKANCPTSTVSVSW